MNVTPALDGAKWLWPRLQGVIREMQLIAIRIAQREATSMTGVSLIVVVESLLPLVGQEVHVSQPGTPHSR